MLTWLSAHGNVVDLCRLCHQVRASAVFVPEMSALNEEEEKYYYSYSIRLSLLPEGCMLDGTYYSSCQLYSRHWIIRSKDAVVSDISAEAVIGKVWFATILCILSLFRQTDWRSALRYDTLVSFSLSSCYISHSTRTWHQLHWVLASQNFTYFSNWSWVWSLFFHEARLFFAWLWKFSLYLKWKFFTKSLSYSLIFIL